MHYLLQAHQSFRRHGWLAAIACWITVALPFLVVAGRAPSDIGISLIALSFIAHSARIRDWGWITHGWLKAALILWAYMVLSALLAEQVPLALSKAAVWIRYPIFAIALAHLVMLQAPVRTLFVLTSALAWGFLLLDGYGQYVWGSDIFGREIIQHAHIFRLTGPFSSPRLGITLVWFFLPIACLFLARGAPRSAPMVAGIVAMAATMVLVYVSGERMASLFMLMAALMLIVLSNPLRWRMVLATLLALTIGALFTQQDTQIANRHIAQTQHDVEGFTHSNYGKAWQSAVMVWQSSPLVGVGAKHFQHTCETLRASTQQADMFCPMHPHNVVLEWLVYHGAIGLVLFMVVLGCWLRIAWRHRARIYTDALCCGVFVTLCIRFVPFASTASQFTAWSAVPLWLCVGWLIALLTIKESEHADRAIAR
jgi:O-antigen ligase